jgi:hypothetical protein
VLGNLYYPDHPPEARRQVPPQPYVLAGDQEPYSVLDPAKFGEDMPDPYISLGQYRTVTYPSSYNTNINNFNPKPDGHYSFACENAGKCNDGQHGRSGWAKYNCDTASSADGNATCDTAKPSGIIDAATSPQCNGKRVYCVPPIVAEGENDPGMRHKYFAFDIPGLRVVQTKIMQDVRE